MLYFINNPHFVEQTAIPVVYYSTEVLSACCIA
jgi:hypothetical protein